MLNLLSILSIPSLTLLGPVGAILDVFQGLVMAIFIITGLLLTLVVLMQEGKGGGIAGAFGGAGAEAFGVKAGTVNRFTFWVGGVFLATALLHAGLASTSALPVDPNQKLTAPVPSGDAPSTPTVPPAEPAPAAPAPAPDDGNAAPGDAAPGDAAPGDAAPGDAAPGGTAPSAPPPAEPAPEPAPVPPGMGG